MHDRDDDDDVIHHREEHRVGKSPDESAPEITVLQRMSQWRGRDTCDGGIERLTELDPQPSSALLVPSERVEGVDAGFWP